MNVKRLLICTWALWYYGDNGMIYSLNEMEVIIMLKPLAYISLDCPCCAFVVAMSVGEYFRYQWQSIFAHTWVRCPRCGSKIYI